MKIIKLLGETISLGIVLGMILQQIRDKRAGEDEYRAGSK